MCMFTPDMPPTPQLPPEQAQERAPDRGTVVGNVSRRVRDRLRGSNTILTSGSGVTEAGQTERRTLLGQ